MSCHYFFTFKKCFFLLNFSDVNGLKSPFRAPSSFLKCQFLLKLLFKDIPFKDILFFKRLKNKMKCCNLKPLQEKGILLL